MTNNAIFSTMIRSGRTTYFVDVKEAKNGQQFVAISESRLDSENKKQHSTVRVFGHAAEEFRKGINEAVTAMTLQPEERFAAPQQKPSNEAAVRVYVEILTTNPPQRTVEIVESALLRMAQIADSKS